MPFDAAGWVPERRTPRRRAFSETALHLGLAFLALCLLMLPVSVPAFVDLVRYLRGH